MAKRAAQRGRGTKRMPKAQAPALAGYGAVLAEVADLLAAARRASARAVNVFMTVTYWQIGRRIVEWEQGGKARADYGQVLLARLSMDLTDRFGRGFSRQNLQQMRQFYLEYPVAEICQTVSGKSVSALGATLGGSSSSTICQTVSGILPTMSAKPRAIISETASRKSRDENAQTLSALSGSGYAGSGSISPADLARRFPLPWSHYVRLLSVKSPETRAFYEAEALRGGWSVRQLDRQVSTQSYERTLMSRHKLAMLRKGEQPRADEILTPEQEIKDPFVLEFLGLKDEYSETDLEEALANQLQGFLMELGGDFAFVARQRRLRVGDEWYRVDLIFFHRRLRCLVVIDLKAGKFTHADAGQMHLYLNYAREHWCLAGENPPVGLVLCAAQDAAVAHYALDGLPNQVLAAEYRTKLPREKVLVAELERTRRLVEGRGLGRRGPRSRR